MYKGVQETKAVVAGVEKFIFLHQKNSDKRNFTLKITYNFLSCPFSESKSKGIIFFWGGFSYFFQNPRVQRMAIGNISRRPISIRSAQMYLATGERMDHEWAGP